MKISLFDKVDDTNPKKETLDGWLKETINPSDYLKKRVEEYRVTKNKSIKNALPCVTISATFKKNRNLKNIKKINPFIVIDIDRKSKSKLKPSNTCLDMQLAKDLISRHKSTTYCGYSVSNDGIYAIIKLEKPKKLKKYFKQLKKSLLMHGIAIDDSCKDYTRLRFFSYDKDAYYNPKAQPLKLIEKEKQKTVNTEISRGNEIDKINKIVDTIESSGIDITSDYSDWVKIAGALISELGENGRSYFHRISSFHKDYKKKRCDDKFDSCRKMNKINIGSFYYIADSYGIRY